MNNEIFNRFNRVIKHWYMPLILGIIFIVVAIWVLLKPEKAFISLTIVFSITFIFTGVMGIISSIQFKNLLNGWNWLLASGIVDFLVGILLILNPQISIVVLTLSVGFVCFYHSVMAITWSIELKKYKAPNRGRLLFTSILGVAFSVLLLWNPAFAQLTLVFYTSFALLMIGISEIYFSSILQKLNDRDSHQKDEMKEEILTSKKIASIGSIE